jgi:predicted phage terminase large subunit-like protein
MNLLSYTTFCNPKYIPHWYHQVVAETLDKWIRHEIRNLIIVMPPRHGKTELASRNLPAYILGRAPTKLIIAAAATAELAEANSRDVKKIMRSPQHIELFGDTTADSKEKVKDTEKVWQLAQGGTYNACGVGNNIAGRGADYIIVDDYINNRESAESATQRDKMWSWFLDDILTRRHYPGSTLVMATRWHFDDIIGRIEQGENNEEWTILHLPKMLEGKPGPFDLRKNEGDMLLSPFSIAPWEYLKGQTPPAYDDFLQKESVQVTHAELQRREKEAFEGRRSKNAYGVDALEQGNPVPKEGGLFKASWIKRYTAAPHTIAESADYLLISIDAAMKDTKTSDNCSIVVFARIGPMILLLEEDTDKMDYPLLKQRVRIMAKKYPSATIVIEDKANGIALVAELKKELPRVIPFDPGPYGNKASRAQIAADRYESGSLLHPLEMHAPWIDNFEAELTGFPFRKRDDRVDAVSQAVLFMDKKKGATARLDTAQASIESLLASF